MARFHLNIFDDVDVRDIEGVERLDLAAAILDAIAGARGLMASHIVKGIPISLSYRIEITDGTGVLLHTIRFGDVIDVGS